MKQVKHQNGNPTSSTTEITMILSDLNTWPPALNAFLESQLEKLSAYVIHKRETMHAYINPVGKHVPMALMPSNPHYREYHDIAAQCVRLVQNERLEGWHCTRITEAEAADILANGLQLLDPELIERKITLLLAQKLIDPRTAEALRNQSLAEDDGRSQMIWFCFFEPRLTWQSGLERFFRYWGGEAIYVPQHSSPLLSTLMTIGRPCLIQANVPVASLAPYSCLGEKIILNFLQDRGVDTDEDRLHEDNARIPLAPENVMRLVYHGEQEFADLTGCSSWDPPL